MVVLLVLIWAVAVFLVVAAHVYVHKLKRGKYKNNDKV